MLVLLLKLFSLCVKATLFVAGLILDIVGISALILILILWLVMRKKRV